MYTVIKSSAAIFIHGIRRQLEVYRWIAEQHMPLMFHSGILYDGINASGKYNRPCEFEPLYLWLVCVFPVAHVHGPGLVECIAVMENLMLF